jgi:hypothetical protein
VRKGEILIAIFGALDLFSFYRSFPGLIRVVENFSGGVIPVLHILLVLSLLVSGPLLIVGNRTGYTVYYFQFPLKLWFLIVTFGFITKIVVTQYGTFAHGMLWATIFALEAVRLMLTIQKNKVNI